MAKLFIIGNGFDRAHDMSTSPEDFHEFLRDKYNLTDEDEWLLDDQIEFDTDRQRLPITKERETARLFCGLVSKYANYESWQDIEKAMGCFDYYECFDESCQPETDWDDEFDKQRKYASFNAVDRANEIYSVLNDIEPILRKWIETVKISNNKKNSFETLINTNEDLFFNFNYTMTLESLYRCKKIWHIHGCVTNEDKLVIGHGNDEKDYYIDDKLPDSDEAKSIIEELHRKLRKNTRGLIEKNKPFFEELKLSNITGIYSYGFSFSDVDLPYVEHICKYLDTNNITWFLNDFNDEKDKKDFIEKITKCGFKGKYSIFSVHK